MRVVTPKEMSGLDRKTIEGGVPSLELMEKAGTKCYEIIKENIEPGQEVLVICGTGNNGGDGQVIARLLKKAGYPVTVLFTSSRDNLLSKGSEESLNNLLQLEKLEVPLYYAANEDVYLDLIPKFPVIVDAIFGTGFRSGNLSDYYKKLFEAINESSAKVIAIDIPSGLDGVNGSVQVAVHADLTIIIQFVKTGELLEYGPDYTGRKYVVDIGIEDDETLPRRKLLTEEDLIFPNPRYKNSHKYHYGRVVIIAGSKGMLGAAALASSSALKSGAGLVTNYVPNEVYTAAVSVMPLEALVESYNRILTAYNLNNVKRDVILVGPGLGKSNDYSGLIEDLLDREEPIVIDADGLWMMRNSLNRLKKAKAPVIITPHHGEFAKLLDITLEELKADPLYYASSFSQTYNVVVVLKAHHTLIVSPNGEIWFNTTGNAGMATPGSGDVLAGMTAGILAQLQNPLEAAKAAVYYHGLAGDYYVNKYGPTTLIASDLIEYLKYALK